MEGLYQLSGNRYEYEGIEIITDDIKGMTGYALCRASAQHIRSASLSEYYHSSREQIPYASECIWDFVDGRNRITAVVHDFRSFDPVEYQAIRKCRKMIDHYYYELSERKYIASHP